MGCVSKFPDRAKWAPQGPRRQNRGALVFAMDPVDAFTITPKMQGFEPSIDLEFENCFFQKGCQLNSFFFGTFLPSSMRSRDTVKMQGFELAATLVPPSDFQNFFWGPRRASGDPDKTGNRSVLSPSLRGRVAEQDPCIFTRDYASPRPPTQ